MLTEREELELLNLERELLTGKVEELPKIVEKVVEPEPEPKIEPEPEPEPEPELLEEPTEEPVEEQKKDETAEKILQVLTEIKDQKPEVVETPKYVTETDLLKVVARLVSGIRESAGKLEDRITVEMPENQSIPILKLIHADLQRMAIGKPPVSSFEVEERDINGFIKKVRVL